MAKKITITISDYEYRMIMELKDRVTSLNDGELSLLGDILLENIKL
jgi:hypothetical protein